MTDVLTQTQPRWRLTADPSVSVGSLDPSATLSGDLQGWRLPVADSNESTWPEGAVRRLGALNRLHPGWDGDSARAPSPAILAAVSQFVLSDLVAGLAAKPDLVPTAEGGILIEWHTEAVDLIIEPSVSGEAGSYYFCDNETGEEVEEALGGPAGAITAAFVKLGLRP